MKFKELIKSYSFWTTLAGAIVVLIEVLGRIFNFSISEKLIHDLIMAIAGVLVAFGIVTMPKITSKDSVKEQKVDEEAKGESSEGKDSAEVNETEQKTSEELQDKTNDKKEQ